MSETNIQDELSAWQLAAAALIQSYEGHVMMGHDKETNEVVVLIGHEPEKSVHVYPDGNIENSARERTRFSEDPGKKLVEFVNYMTVFSPVDYIWGPYDPEDDDDFDGSDLEN